MSMSKARSGGKILVSCLERMGVQNMFAFLGGANLPVGNAIHGSEHIKLWPGIHEQCVGHAAEGYAKMHNNKFPGVALVTSGPGLTNAITPLYNAKADGTPIILFSGQVPTSAIGTDAFQECPAVDLTTPCTKWSYQVRTINEIPDVVNEAFRVALSGRPGPVAIDLPKDIMTMKTEDDVGHSKYPKEYEPKPLSKEVKQIIKYISKAKRPIIIAGAGCKDCPHILEQFVNKTEIPVVSTLHGLGSLSDTHPHSIGFVGMHGNPASNIAVQNSDLIISLGSRFDDRITGGYNNFAPHAIKLHVDIDKEQLTKVAKIANVDHSYHSTVYHMLSEIMNHKDFKRTFRDGWLDEVYQWQIDNDIFGNYKPPEDSMKVQCVLRTMNNIIQENDLDVTFTTGVGNHQMMCAQYMTWRKPNRLITSGSAGTMGVATPFAIGAAVADSDANIVTIDGDGSFNMTSMELATIARNKLPIKMCIMNDGRQQMVHIWQELFFDKNIIGTLNHNPDYLQLAEAHGIPAIRCDDPSKLNETIDEMLFHDGPLLVDFRVKPDICLPLVPPGNPIDKMIMTKPDYIDGGMAPS
jgi:acetolactate synthase I/II/III large subunit